MNIVGCNGNDALSSTNILTLKQLCSLRLNNRAAASHRPDQHIFPTPAGESPSRGYVGSRDPPAVSSELRHLRERPGCGQSLQTSPMTGCPRSQLEFCRAAPLLLSSRGSALQAELDKHENQWQGAGRSDITPLVQWLRVCWFVNERNDGRGIAMIGAASPQEDQNNDYSKNNQSAYCSTYRGADKSFAMYRRGDSCRAFCGACVGSWS